MINQLLRLSSSGQIVGNIAWAFVQDDGTSANGVALPIPDSFGIDRVVRLDVGEYEVFPSNISPLRSAHAADYVGTGDEADNGLMVPGNTTNTSIIYLRVDLGFSEESGHFTVFFLGGPIPGKAELPVPPNPEPPPS